ncbi:MAG TPA: caspase family protein [Polyangiaceae bacterium]|nr:caspase family protein [Polyangiaceae bacterium]
MARRAFVVGSETEGLSGANDDARRIELALRSGYGFEVDLCVGRDATRAGILAGYDRLIEASGADDAALFYYSGHGAFVEGPGPEGRGLRHAQCIVPVDYHESSDEAFHGILAQELSLWLARLTAKTKNVAVVLDCCHASGMSRDVSARPKALRRPIEADVKKLDDEVRKAREKYAAELAGLDPESNPHAVRLVATGLRNYAWEYTTDAGRRAGALTEALLLALGEAKGQTVTWEAVGDRVREQVLARFPSQRPEIEGPARRLLFDRAEGDATGALSLAYDAKTGRHLLRGGRVHGVHEGNEYGLMAPGGAVYDAKKALGTATVVEVGANESAVSLSLAAGRLELPQGARAFPLRSAAPRRPVRLEAPGAARAAIARSLAADPLLRAVEGEGSDALPLLARVRVADGRIELIEPSGKPALEPMPYDEHSIRDLRANLHRMAAVQRLRELKSEPSAGLPAGSVEVRWGRVEGDEQVELKAAGELLEVDQAVYVKVRNAHPEKKDVYVSIIDLGVAKKVTLLTRSWPSGRELKFGEEYVFGEGAGRKLKGAKLGWPAGLPKDEPRAETILVVATEKPQNLLPVEQESLATTTRGNGGWSALSQLVARAQGGGTRDVSGPREAEGFLVHPIEFQLSPWPLNLPNRKLPKGEGFLIDDRPPPSAIAFAASGGAAAPKGPGAGLALAGVPRGAEAAGTSGEGVRGFGPAVRAPRRLALRINELVVHDVRTLFGGGDVRVDALVITRRSQAGAAAPAAGAAPGPGEPFLAVTRQFPDVRDGQRLPFDDVLIYEGEVRDFVDLRVWVSRDRDGAKMLSELLREQLNSDELRTAAATVLGLTAVAPQAGALVAAVGAAATVGTIAWRLLAGALPTSIGVYQTSLLAIEGFKVGRHPAQGHFRAQGFSFGYEVLAAG